jgi:chaperone modulatory protein CbpM
MAEYEAVWLHSRHQLTLIELAECSGLSEEEVRELVEYGALAPADAASAEWTFAAACVSRVRTAARLRNDLELETRALALVLRFLERIEALESQVRELNAKRASPF